MRTAIGLIAGPESPPRVVCRRGRRVQGSIAMPSTVLIAERMSAPPAFAASPIATGEVTLG